MNEVAFKTFLIESFTPDIALSLTMKQVLKHENGNIEFLNPQSASQNAKHFLNILNREVHGNIGVRIGKKLKVITTIEGSWTEEKRYHLHMAIKYPEEIAMNEISKVRFRNQVQSCWLRTRWGYHEYDIQDIYDWKGWLNYISKEGTDSVDFNNCHW